MILLKLYASMLLSSMNRMIKTGKVMCFNDEVIVETSEVICQLNWLRDSVHP